VGVVEAVWVTAKYLKLWRHTEIGIPTSQLKNTSRNLMENGKQFYRSAFGAASDTAKEMRDTAAAGAKAVKDTTVSSAQSMKDSAMAGARSIRDSAAEAKGYRAEPGELERKSRRDFDAGNQQQRVFQPNEAADDAAGTGTKLDAYPQQFASAYPTQSPFSLQPAVVPADATLPPDVVASKSPSDNSNINNIPPPAQRAE